MDYTLLRPFDLEAAKAGEALINPEDGTECLYVAGPHPITQEIVVDFNSPYGFDFGEASDFRMAPLCWVEGRPVYKGDVLYSAFLEGSPKRTVTGIDDDGILSTEERGLNTCDPEDLTWTPPKVKREGWVNVYPKPTEELVASVSHAHASKEKADSLAASGRIACIRIEWEEPAK